MIPRSLIATSLTCTLLPLVAHGQGRELPVLPPSIDVKTPAEPSRPPDMTAQRPAVRQAALLPESEPALGRERRRALDPNAPVSGLRGVDHTRMHYDAPGDGSLWARGATYKASFDAAGATYFPLFGCRQPRHQPVALSPDVVTLGGEAISVGESPAAVRDENRIELDRGGFVERYDLSPQSVEQSFVFASLHGSGDLLIHVPLAQGGEPVTAESTGDGLEIRSELGCVGYGRATAIDARGQRASLITEFTGGSITIRVDASFVAAAALPLVVDPVVSTLSIDTTSFDDFYPDVAYDASTDRWLAVYEETATAGDRDVYYEMLNAAGSSMWGGYVNSNNANWYDPNCANLAAADQFLVVCGVNATTIRGRTIEAAISSIGAEFFISGSETGDKFNPDVGGDPYPSLPSYYCVAYERKYSTSDHDILVRLVAPSSTLVGTGPIYLSNSGGTIDEIPSVSKGNDGTTWTIAWERYIDSSVAEIWAGRIAYAGSIVDNPFQLTGGTFDTQPCVSSPLKNTQKVMIAFSRWYGTDSDIHVMVQEGLTPIASVDLSTLETTGLFLRDQSFPNVDSDGQHFLVGYSEQHATSLFDYDVYVDDLYLSGNTIGISQQHVGLGVFGGIDEGGCHIASAGGPGGATRRYLAGWTRESTATNRDVIGALFDGYLGGPVDAFCFGDGTGTACPCGNFGAAGHGCASSVNPAGARLFAAGVASVSNDVFVLEADGLPSTAPCLFFQATGQGVGAAFGDGLRCTTGTVIRLGGHSAFNGFCSYPNFGDPTVSVKGAVPAGGATRTYQVWYRNAAAFCTSATFNFTNGLRAVWTH